MKSSLLAGTILIASATSGVAAEHEQISPYLGCYERAKVEKILNDGNYVTLVRGSGADMRINELWINSTGYAVTVTYDKPKNDDEKNIKKVCVTNVVKSSVFNGETIEVMHSSLKSTEGKI